MKKQSAGILLFRHRDNDIEVLLVHPGGPFWAKKDEGVWSIPKGEFESGEEPLDAARREFAEELGRPVPGGELIPLGEAKQPSGKVVHAWALEADFDVSTVQSNSVTIEWPPKSGQQQQFPEIDRATWLTFAKARAKLLKGQVSLLEVLAARVDADTALAQPVVQGTLF